MDKKFTTYSIEELAADESFISWVTSGDNGQEWEQFMEKNPSLNDRVHEAKELVVFLRREPTKMTPEVKKNLWAHIDAKTPQEAVVKPMKTQWTKWASAAAAVLIIGWVSISLFNNSSIEEHITQNNQMASVNLPDDSFIKLNSASKLTYDEDNFNSDRKLNLQGEAFFQVEKGSSFTVDLDHGSVTVLGTSFNIYARTDSISVVCYTGKVSVKNERDEEVILTKGMSASFTKNSNKQFSSKNILLSEEPTWMSGRFEYEDRPLHEIFDELSRQYDVAINYPPSIAKKRVNFSFSKEGIEKIIKEIAFIADINDYTISGKNVTISE